MVQGKSILHSLLRIPLINNILLPISQTIVPLKINFNSQFHFLVHVQSSATKNSEADQAHIFFPPHRIDICYSSTLFAPLSIILTETNYIPRIEYQARVFFSPPAFIGYIVHMYGRSDVWGDIFLQAARSLEIKDIRDADIGGET